MMAFSFHEAKTASEKAACLDIRRVVFIEGQGVPTARELKDEGEACRHFYVKEGNVIVGTLRILTEGKTAKLQRMAILEQYRGKTLGQQLLEYVVELLSAEKNLHKVILGAQDHAVSFYEKAGFEKRGEPFIDAGISHILMEKQLSEKALNLTD